MILQGLRHYGDVEVSDHDLRLYRAAALVHDIGHYPFSHPMEQALKRHYKPTALKPAGGGEAADILDHEDVGKLILEVDPEVQAVLQKHKLEAHDLSAIFKREKPPQFANLVNSDLDADKLDYLLRTALHTGLPYGGVDLQYLVTQMRVDDKGRLCLTTKALRTADHVMLARYFDRVQVIYHKTVAGLEALLQDTVQDLLRTGIISCSAEEVRQMVTSGRWYDFHDGGMFEHIKQLSEKANEGPIVRERAMALLRRTPPKLVANFELLAEQEAGEPEFTAQRSLLKSNLTKWAAKAGLGEEYLRIWEMPGLALTVMPDIVESVRQGGKIDDELVEQAVRILKPGATTSEPLMTMRSSVMFLLKDRQYFGLRLYALLPEGFDREKLASAVRQDLDPRAWDVPTADPAPTRVLLPRSLGY
jgi:uncharacterized protein